MDETELIALVDGELDGDKAAALNRRIAADESLRSRYEALRAERAAIRAAFESLLAQAPVARLKAFIPPEAPASAPRPARRFSLRDLAAGLAVGFALTAAAMTFLGRQTAGRDDWREAVVDYMALYTNETFAAIPANAEARAAELGAVGSRVGEALTPEAVSLPGLDLRTAFILAYEKKPLGEVVQTAPNGAPVLFCILASGAADAPLKSETRDGFALASWARGGKGYLVIADLPEAQVAGYAQALMARF